MCNLTSLARTLDAQGVSLDGKWQQAEDLLEELKGLRERTDSQTLIWLAERLGMTGTKWLWQGGKAKDNISRREWEDFQAKQLDRGYSIMMSIGGHIIVLQEVTAKGLVVDDPFGRLQLLPTSEKYDRQAKERYWRHPVRNDNRNGLAGNDNLLPWSDVLAHRMHWVLAVGVSPP